MTATGTTRTPGRGLSTTAALLLAIVGNILVVAITAAAVALVVIAGVIVFGVGILEGI